MDMTTNTKKLKTTISRSTELKITTLLRLEITKHNPDIKSVTKTSLTQLRRYR